METNDAGDTPGKGHKPEETLHVPMCPVGRGTQYSANHDKERCTDEGRLATYFRIEERYVRHGEQTDRFDRR
jgi:hypothetical protein